MDNVNKETKATVSLKNNFRLEYANLHKSIQDIAKDRLGGNDKKLSVKNSIELRHNSYLENFINPKYSMTVGEVQRSKFLQIDVDA
jgi:hypothetical protein